MAASQRLVRLLGLLQPLAAHPLGILFGLLDCRQEDLPGLLPRLAQRFGDFTLGGLANFRGLTLGLPENGAGLLLGLIESNPVQRSKTVGWLCHRARPKLGKDVIKTQSPEIVKSKNTAPIRQYPAPPPDPCRRSGRCDRLPRRLARGIGRPCASEIGAATEGLGRGSPLVSWGFS